MILGGLDIWRSVRDVAKVMKEKVLPYYLHPKHLSKMNILDPNVEMLNGNSCKSYSEETSISFIRPNHTGTHLCERKATTRFHRLV
jgi:hypothetical protein